MGDYITPPPRVAAIVGDAIPVCPLPEMAATLAAAGVPVLPGQRSADGYLEPIPRPGAGLTLTSWQSATTDAVRVAGWWQEDPGAFVLMRLTDRQTGYSFCFAYADGEISSIPEHIDRMGAR